MTIFLDKTIKLMCIIYYKTTCCYSIAFLHQRSKVTKIEDYQRWKATTTQLFWGSNIEVWPPSTQLCFQISNIKLNYIRDLPEY